MKNGVYVRNLIYNKFITIILLHQNIIIVILYNVFGKKTTDTFRSRNSW